MLVLLHYFKSLHFRRMNVGRHSVAEQNGVGGSCACPASSASQGTTQKSQDFFPLTIDPSSSSIRHEGLTKQSL